MLQGKAIQLRPVRERDLDELYSRHLDIANRGEFFPVGVMAEPEFQRRFQDDGFWGKDGGMLVITDEAGCILGHIEYFKTVNYLDELELSYQIYAPDQRGQGHTTEAVSLLVRYLFDRLKTNRIRLIIHPDNLASRRVAEKCGFRHEGTARGAWFHRGRSQDVEVYAILRDEVANAEDGHPG